MSRAKPGSPAWDRRFQAITLLLQDVGDDFLNNQDDPSLAAFLDEIERLVPLVAEYRRIRRRQSSILREHDAANGVIKSVTDCVATNANTCEEPKCSRHGPRTLVDEWRAASNVMSEAEGDGPYRDTLRRCAQELENRLRADAIS